MVLVNVEESSSILRDLNMYCFRMKWTLILSYSVDEAAEYLENLKLAENRTPESIINNFQQKKEQNNKDEKAKNQEVSVLAFPKIG